MYDKILQLIREKGPSLPAEISGKLNMNSFMAKAYMEELVNQGKLKLGEKIGSTNMFLLPGQEEQAAKLTEELLHPTRTVGSHVGKDLDMSPEAVAKREGFKKHFEKDIARFQEEPKKKLEFAPLEKLDIKQVIPAESFVIEPEPPKPIPVKIPQKLIIPKPKEEFKPVQKEGYVERIINMFGSDRAKVVDEISVAKKTAEFIIDIPSSIGALRFYVEVKDKKSISKADVSLAYTEGLARKLPSMIITNGKLAKPAEAYAENLGSLFKLKIIN